jgi:16S rRNA (guanine966-N2)-methyltransferase
MRVIAGKFKGRRLLCPSGITVRPTADAAKETTFNLLGDRVEGSRVIDLFAGAGVLGIEALSRGAHDVDFVERGRTALKYLAKNLDRVGVDGGARILRGDVFAWIAKLHSMSTLYDLAFVDPPYGVGLVARTLHAESESGLVVGGGILVVRHHSKEGVAPLGARYELESERRFGDTLVTILKIA